MPCTSIASNAFFTSSSLNGLMTATTSFIPFLLSDALERVAGLGVLGQVQARVFLVVGHSDAAGQHRLEPQTDQSRHDEREHQHDGNGEHLFTEQAPTSTEEDAVLPRRI